MEFDNKSPFSNTLLRDWRAWSSVFLAVNLINLPNLIAALVPAFSWPFLQLWLFGLALILLPCVFGLRVRPMLWLASPLVLLVPACLISLYALLSLPSTFLLLALIESNQAELTVFQAYIIYGVAGTLLLAALYVWILRKRVPADLRLGPVGRSLILVSLLAAPASDFLQGGRSYCLAQIEMNLMNTFPYSTLRCAHEAFDLRSRVQDRKNLAEHLPITQEPGFRDESHRQVHMLVIGESATKSCFGLYGYERPTTPLLEKIPGLLRFRDVSCTATMTLMAVPAILTATPPGRVLEATRQASIISAYKKAGFRIYWLSSQKKHGTFDTLTSMFSAEADEAVFLGGKFDAAGKGAYRSAHDADLLPLVHDLLDRKDPKVLFVLHTIGSHGPYTARCPPEMIRFPADNKAVRDTMMRVISGLETAPEDLQIVQNSYDNTICATDALLDALINELKQSQASSWLCYLSDHGENTSRSIFGKFMHGTVSPQVVEIPMLMWLSPLYTQAHPEKLSSLEANRNTPFSASCTFHTLLDMGGLSCPGFKKDWSAASSPFTPAARIVCSPNGVIVDYDKQFPARREASRSLPPQPMETTRQFVTGGEQTSQPRP
ncbi:MAG: sulfatase-like hydrolase/transferase [Verrucomicrobia bacterium]|nr:sulfatase-like hydrolase/transferase [Verrucomicrobiota bacterium]